MIKYLLNFSNRTITYNQRTKLLPVGVWSDLKSPAQFLGQLLRAGPRAWGGGGWGQCQTEGVSSDSHFFRNGLPRLLGKETLS